MPNPATVRERRLRKTKAQLIDEIDTLEQRAAAIEATYVSTQTDVTDLKRTEEARRKSEERFSSLVSNIAGAVYRCACDKDWTMAFMSDAIEQLTGYPAAHFTGAPLHAFMEIVHAEDRAEPTADRREDQGFEQEQPPHLG